MKHIIQYNTYFIYLSLFLFICPFVSAQVGIGTTTPNEDLHVVGKIQVTDAIRLGGDASNANGTSSIGAADQVILSDGTKSYWGDLTGIKGTIITVHNKIGTTTVTVPQGTTSAVPGLSQTITVAAGQSRILLLTVLGYAIKASGTASQGVFGIYVDGVKISSGYVSSTDSGGAGGLNNLPTPVSFNSTAIIAPGTHTIDVRFKSWYNSQAINTNAYPGYAGSIASDTEALKSRLTIVEFSN